MQDQQNSKDIKRRSRAIRLLFVVLFVFFAILGIFLFAPGVLGASLYGNSIFTIGLFVSFLFIVFIIYITYVYAYSEKDD